MNPSKGNMLSRAIPKTGENLPVIGIGTWQTFDIGDEPRALDNLLNVLRLFLDGGGRVIDSSPMYGRAEAVAGELLAQAGVTIEAVRAITAAA